jgi:dynactin 5
MSSIEVDTISAIPAVGTDASGDEVLVDGGNVGGTRGSGGGGYIQTTTHNYISRQAIVVGAKHVEIKGRTIVEPTVKICGNDSTWIRIGRYCYIQTGTTIEPPTMMLLPSNTSNSTNNPDSNDDKNSNNNDNDNSNNKYIPVQIGSHTIVGNDCSIQAAAIGSYCMIGNNVSFGQRCIIKDCCLIESNVCIPPDTVIPPFTRDMMTGSGSSNASSNKMKKHQFQHSNTLAGNDRRALMSSKNFQRNATTYRYKSDDKIDMQLIYNSKLVVISISFFDHSLWSAYDVNRSIDKRFKSRRRMEGKTCNV